MTQCEIGVPARVLAGHSICHIFGGLGFYTAFHGRNVDAFSVRTGMRRSFAAKT
ncbi:hypothetical protein QOZ99_001373 [Angulomicrobium amanitiforme]|uniref:Uncharacterized protein n=1 Tax=Ancylobacter amanitiformis TaxID=217069 RepID=A0ABU0LP55_9HYPH|nr:hypothetical protein [Ancylobacter amanitiformis]